MDYQLTLPLARRTDPRTSHRAGASVSARRPSQRDTLLKAYVAHPDGLIDEQAGTVTGLALRPRCCFWKRCSELRQLGLIATNGETRPSTAGELQRVCVITEAGRRAVEGMKAEAV